MNVNCEVASWLYKPLLGRIVVVQTTTNYLAEYIKAHIVIIL
jgi:hypothetical protein